jgi:uridine phosphorylase
VEPFAWEQEHRFLGLSAPNSPPPNVLVAVIPAAQRSEVRSAFAFLASRMFFYKKNHLAKYLRAIDGILSKFYIMDCCSERAEIFV